MQGNKERSEKVFPNLNAEMARRKIDIKSLAKITGIQYETLKNKLSGKTEFKRSEMYRIKTDVFPLCTIDYLFATELENDEKR